MSHELQEAEQAQISYEMDLLDRIKQGLTTAEDADYLSGRLGLSNFYKVEHEQS